MIIAALQLSCAISAPASKEIYGDFSSETKQGRALLGVLGQDIPHLCKFPPPGSAGEEKPRSKAPRANTELCLSRWDPALAAHCAAPQAAAPALIPLHPSVAPAQQRGLRSNKKPILIFQSPGVNPS